MGNWRNLHTFPRADFLGLVSELDELSGVGLLDVGEMRGVVLGFPHLFRDLLPQTPEGHALFPLRNGERSGGTRHASLDRLLEVFAHDPPVRAGPRDLAEIHSHFARQFSGGRSRGDVPAVGIRSSLRGNGRRSG
jgi:hypothetical protein